MKVNGFLKTETAKPKYNGTHLPRNNDQNGHDLIGDNHVATSLETPVRADAFLLSDEQKMVLIENKFREIMNVLGLDLKDDSLNGTPHRVSKMFVKEIFSGLNPANKPKISVFENKFKYGEMLVEKNISLNSTCEHHFLPIVGKAHVAYTVYRYLLCLRVLPVSLPYRALLRRLSHQGAPLLQMLAK